MNTLINMAQKPQQQCRKFLFMGHVAIGDMLYILPVLECIKKQFPGIEIDVWTDDLRKQPKPWVPERNDALSTIKNTSTAITTLYPIARSQEQREQACRDAQVQGYDTILYLASGRVCRFRELAHRISPRARIVGNAPKRLWDRLLFAWRRRERTTTLVPPADPEKHISEYYLQCFHRVFDFDISPIPVPFVFKLEPSQRHIKKVMSGLSSRILIFINGEASNAKKSMSPQKIVQVMEALSQKVQDIAFIINASPRNKVRVNNALSLLLQQSALSWRTFSADTDFMMLPGVIACSDLVISVDTSITHITLGLDVAQVSLLRKKNFPWRPFNKAQVLMNDKAVDAIPVKEIVASSLRLLSRRPSAEF